MLRLDSGLLQDGPQTWLTLVSTTAFSLYSQTGSVDIYSVNCARVHFSPTFFLIPSGIHDRQQLLFKTEASLLSRPAVLFFMLHARICGHVILVHVTDRGVQEKQHPSLIGRSPTPQSRGRPEPAANFTEQALMSVFVQVLGTNLGRQSGHKLNLVPADLEAIVNGISLKSGLGFRPVGQILVTFILQKERIALSGIQLGHETLSETFFVIPSTVNSFVISLFIQVGLVTLRAHNFGL